ncbi:hypothetical protein V3G39_05445 [Dermatophilaceae bacterium Sec6.4]
MQVRKNVTCVGAVVTGALLIAGCGSNSGTAAPAVSNPPSVTKGASSPSGASTSAPSSSTSTGSSTSSVAGTAKTFTKGQKVESQKLQRVVKAAVAASGGSYAVRLTAAGLAAVGHIKLVHGATQGSVQETAGETKISIIIIGGVAYLKGLGVGSKPWVKITDKSTGTLAEAFKPLLQIADGAAVSDSVQWTVTSATASGTTLTSSPATGITVTDQLDAKNRPVLTVVTSPAGTRRETYSDYGTPVNVQAPPASQVAAIPGDSSAT